jgi:hypothetical protein
MQAVTGAGRCVFAVDACWSMMRLWVAYPLAADNVSGPLPIRLRRVH